MDECYCNKHHHCELIEGVFKCTKKTYNCMNREFFIELFSSAYVK